MFKILLLTIIFFFKTVTVFSEIIKDFRIEGNNRVSESTIINFSDLKKGKDISSLDLNESLKKLYDTNFFENVSISITNNLVTIKVDEYPIIQEINIEGIKRKQTVKELKEQISLKEKNPFNETLIKADLNTIYNIFKTAGFYFVEIDVQVQKNENKTVNIIYQIDRGEKATIKEIKFIGDKKFKNRKLHSVITSEEEKFWKLISKQKYLNLERINLDKRLLKNFYLNKGYYQVVINDAYSKMINNKDFILTFNIESGKKFKFGNLSLSLPNDFDPNKFKDLEKIFQKLNGSTYNYNRVEKILDEIEKIALYSNYEFINAEIEEEVLDENINFIFNIKESKKVYVDKINILGNHITAEEFIRDNLIVDEGDPFNKILHAKSINNLKSTGIFKSVESEIITTDNDDKNVINLIVEEKPTGEISASAGVGTEGTTFAFGVKENNFNGKGIKLATNLAISDDSIRGLFDYTHPNFAYTDRALSTSLESTATDKLTEFGYKSTLNKISLGTKYEQYDDLFFSPAISISDESLETTSDASDAYKKQEGSYFDTTFAYGLTLDKRNQKFQTTDGYRSSWFQELPVISNSASILNSYSFTAYGEPVDDMVISSGFLVSSINSLSNDDVRVSKRLYAPSTRLRGFQSGAVGPKDGNDYVGGNYLATINTSSTVPFVLQTLESVDLKVFLDVGNVWGVDYSSAVDDSNKLRSASGVALEILTPIGPLSFSFAEAITKASTDKTETFRFQLGTTF